jgi:hypothetical protein
MRGLPDGKDRANPSQESTPRDQITGGYTVETVVSQQPRVRTTDRKYSNTEARGKDSARGRNNTVAYPPHTLQPTDRQNFFHKPFLSEVSQRWGMNTHHLVRPGAKHAGEINDEIQGTGKPQLADDRPRFWTVGDGPVFFPANTEGFHHGPLVRDVRRLAPFPEWSSPPLGGLGDGTRENLLLPQDLICLQRVGFDNTYDMTGHRLPVAHPIVLRQQQGTQAGDTYEEAPCGPVPLWTNPTTVIQIQLDETVNGDQRPHLQPNLGQLREHSDRKEHLDRQVRRREEIMTGNTRPGDPQDRKGTRRVRSPHRDNEEDLRNAALRSWNPRDIEGTRHVGSPHRSGGEDLQNVIDRLGAGRRHERGETRSQAPGQSTQERCEPHSRGTDPNEHRTRRHECDNDFPPDEEHRRAPYEQRGDDQTQERMPRWLPENPTRFAQRVCG